MFTGPPLQGDALSSRGAARESGPLSSTSSLFTLTFRGVQTSLQGDARMRAHIRVNVAIWVNCRSQLVDGIHGFLSYI